MGSRRTLITIAAVAVGAIAVFLIYGYVGSVKDEAFGDAERVKVFVVKQQVPKGTYGEETAVGLIVEDEIPKKFFPPNAVRSLDDIGGKVAIADLAVNQIVTTDMFADPAVVQATFADRLEKINDEDQVAITISVDQVRGVANLLQPGDYVNVMSAPPCESAGGEGDAPVAENEGAAGAGEGGSCTGALSADPRYVYQKAQILAIGQTPVAAPGEVAAASEEEGAVPAETSNAGLITLIVPTRAAQYIAAIAPENIYLNLVSRDYEPVPQEPLDAADPLPAEDGEQLTPYGPSGPDGE
ncbi:MAG TPA: RcpC/CpaB family pilus assembly protein [Acidimicrobiales bacterium]|nr:RcpC/CpaB family pilus assembly protein [Acidimicrobiales bacterium]